MRQWQILVKKELIAGFRDKKWIWVPLVLILLAVMDPVSNYYLPQILESVGGLPDGAVFEMPEVTATDAIAMSIGQLSSLGVLIFVLISMGTIAGERKSGVAELILVKPISYTTYIMSKWTGLLALVLVSYTISMLFAWYYIGLLYTFIPAGDFLFLLFFYGLWFILVATLSIFYNTVFKSPGLVAFGTIATIIVLSVITSLFGQKLNYSPSNLSNHALNYLQTGEIQGALIGSAVTTIVISALLLVWSIYIFQTKEHAS